MKAKKNWVKKENLWECSNCHAEVEEDENECWNCQAKFIEFEEDDKPMSPVKRIIIGIVAGVVNFWFQIVTKW